MTKSVLRTKCENWVHGRCAKIKRVTTRLTLHYVCPRYKGIMKRTVDSIKKLCGEVDTVNGFCYLKDRLISSRGYKMPVTATGRIGWARFREYGQLLHENRFSLRMKGNELRKLKMYYKLNSLLFCSNFLPAINDCSETNFS